MIKTKNSILLKTLAFVANQTQLYFDVPAELKNLNGQRVKTKALQIFNSSTLPVIDGSTVFSSSDILNLTLTLVNLNKTPIVVDLPLASLQRSSNGGFYYEIDDLEIDYASSYLTVQQSTGLSAGEVAAFEVIYSTNSVL